MDAKYADSHARGSVQVQAVTGPATFWMWVAVCVVKMMLRGISHMHSHAAKADAAVSEVGPFAEVWSATANAMRGRPRCGDPRTWTYRTFQKVFSVSSLKQTRCCRSFIILLLAAEQLPSSSELEYWEFYRGLRAFWHDLDWSGMCELRKLSKAFQHAQKDSVSSSFPCFSVFSSFLVT